uniref:Uncharacterized protein n=1 Tax=Glossina pallidipes TaxID=7398 RepID=A0A1B0AIA3_GLOPL
MNISREGIAQLERSERFKLHTNFKLIVNFSARRISTISTSYKIKSNSHSDKDSVLYKTSINSSAAPLTDLKKDEEIYYQLGMTPNDPNSEEDLSFAPFNSVPWNEIELAFTPAQTKCFAVYTTELMANDVAIVNSGNLAMGHQPSLSSSLSSLSLKSSSSLH